MTKSDLGEMQRALAQMLREPAPLPLDAAHTAAARAIARGNDRLSPVEQIEIYREQFFLRHVDALRDDFASIEHLLGCGAFEELARAYLAAHPPDSFTLRDLGHAMARFVARASPYAGDPFLADLARTEWAFVEAFDAPDAPPLDAAVIAGAREDAWPRARVGLHPALQLLALGHPAHEYRRAVRAREEAMRPAPSPAWVVVYRGPESLLFVDVEHDAFALLEQLAAGALLEEACERAARATQTAEEAFAAKLGGWFQTWTRRAWIATVAF